MFHWTQDPGPTSMDSGSRLTLAFMPILVNPETRASLLDTGSVPTPVDLGSRADTEDPKAPNKPHRPKFQAHPHDLRHQDLPHGGARLILAPGYPLRFRHKVQP
jgi:hypothetical protein